VESHFYETTSDMINSCHDNASMAWCRYTPIKKIGEGAYGLVCAATDDETEVSAL